MRHYLGPDVQMRSLGFTASEAYIGTVYDQSDLNLFKVASDDVIEYLDVLREENTKGVVPAVSYSVHQRTDISPHFNFSGRLKRGTDTKSW